MYRSVLSPNITSLAYPATRDINYAVGLLFICVLWKLGVMIDRVYFHPFINMSLALLDISPVN